MKSPGCTPRSSTKIVCRPVALSAPRARSSGTVFSGPPRTEYTRSNWLKPKSSSARASMSASSRRVTFWSAPGRTRRTSGGRSSIARTKYSGSPSLTRPSAVTTLTRYPVSPSTVNVPSTTPSPAGTRGTAASPKRSCPEATASARCTRMVALVPFGANTSPLSVCSRGASPVNAG